MVEIAARPSETSMMVFRLYRSTMTPARGLRATEGPKAKRNRRDTDVAWPVVSNSQTRRAKMVMPDPMRETSWPDQMME
jgi:hypothetical protein